MHRVPLHPGALPAARLKSASPLLTCSQRYPRRMNRRPFVLRPRETASELRMKAKGAFVMSAILALAVPVVSRLEIEGAQVANANLWLAATVGLMAVGALALGLVNRRLARAAPQRRPKPTAEQRRTAEVACYFQAALMGVLAGVALGAGSPLLAAASALCAVLLSATGLGLGRQGAMEKRRARSKAD